MAIVNSTVAGTDKTGFEVLARSTGVQVFTPGDTALHQLNLIAIPGGMLKPNSVLMFDVGYASVTGALANAQGGIWSDSGGIFVGSDITIGSSDAVHLITTVTLNNSLTSQIVTDSGFFEKTNQGQANKNYITTSLDFSSDQLLQFGYKTLNAADSFQLAYWRVSVLI